MGIIARDAVIVIRLHTDPRSFSVLEHKACVHLLENTNDLVFSLTLNDICISQLDELSGASSCWDTPSTFSITILSMMSKSHASKNAEE